MRVVPRTDYQTNFLQVLGQGLEFPAPSRSGCAAGQHGLRTHSLTLSVQSKEISHSNR